MNQSSTRTVELSGGTAYVRCPYDHALVDRFRSWGLSRFWDPQAKCYAVPDRAMTASILAELERIGFEVI